WRPCIRTAWTSGNASQRRQALSAKRGMTDKTDIDGALAVSELLRHGGTEAQIEMLRQQFTIIVEDNKLSGKPKPG
ncbi:MAG: hypothetical protein WBV52_13655, partial [Pseudolabrys sp.]